MNAKTPNSGHKVPQNSRTAPTRRANSENTGNSLRCGASGKMASKKLPDDSAMPEKSNVIDGRHGVTTVPLSEAAARASRDVDPEFVDVPGLFRMFGIRRSLAYSLLDEGLIRGVSLRRQGQTKGKRLFDVASVREFLRSKMVSK